MSEDMNGRIVLAVRAGGDLSGAARRYGVAQPTASKWKGPCAEADGVVAEAGSAQSSARRSARRIAPVPLW